MDKIRVTRPDSDGENSCLSALSGCSAIKGNTHTDRQRRRRSYHCSNIWRAFARSAASRRCRPRDAARSDWHTPCRCSHRPVDASARIFERRRTPRRFSRHPRKLGTLFPRRNTSRDRDCRLKKKKEKIEKYRIRPRLLFSFSLFLPPATRCIHIATVRISAPIFHVKYVCTVGSVSSATLNAADGRMFPVNRVLRRGGRRRAIDGAILYMRESGISRGPANTRPFTIELPIIPGNAAILSCCNKSPRFKRAVTWHFPPMVSCPSRNIIITVCACVCVCACRFIL